MIAVEKIPHVFQPTAPFQYPDHNTTTFEQYFHQYILKNAKELNSSFNYLPIYWTNYYINQNYGKNIHELDAFLNSLSKTKKYFTVIQYDDSIINPAINNLDVLIITQGTTKKSSYIVPLNCMPSPHIRLQSKDIFCSFIGRNTHPIRQNLIHTLKEKKDFLISDKQSYDAFSDILSRSVFCLAPRGYGETSFRICEALQRQSIPVYISDKFAIPFEDKVSFSDYGVLVHESEINNLEEILRSITEDEINNKIEKGKEVYKTYYDYVGCSEQILKFVSSYIKK